MSQAIVAPIPSQPRVVRVAYQGAPGAFSEEAVALAWPGPAESIPSPTFEDALAALENGTVDRALLPVWNSTVGTIAGAQHAIDARGETLVAVRTVDLEIRLQLLARPGTTLERVRFVGSHPAALAQCATLFAAGSGLLACEAFDTAGAARELAACGDRCADASWFSALAVDDASQLAVLASSGAAARYGLVTLRADCQDRAGNFTRFAELRLRDDRGSQPTATRRPST